MRVLIFLLMGLGLALGAGSPTVAETRVPGSSAELRLSFAPVVHAVTPSVVNIYAKRIVEANASPFAKDPFFSQLMGNMNARPRVQNSLGSGVILGSGGIVVSNYHVVGQATEIRVVLADKREYDAEVVLADEATDLAVIQLSGAPDLPALDLADSDTVEVGDLVLAIGNPFGVGQTVSSGIISGVARSGTIEGRSGYFLQTDAPINPGNSGGALVDMAGALVGINSAILTRSGGSNGIGFAIPANLVRQYVEAAVAGKHRLDRPWGGVTVQGVDGPLADALGLSMPQGVLISALHPLSPFATAGLAVGDVITTIGGLPVDGGPEMLFRLLTLGVGNNAEVGYLHDGVATSTVVDVVAPPDQPPRQAVRLDTRNIWNGLSAANVNPAVIEELRLPFDTEGVAVTAVEGYAVRSQLRLGDLLLRINGVPIRSTGDLRRMATARVGGWEILFSRGGQKAVIRLRNR